MVGHNKRSQTKVRGDICGLECLSELFEDELMICRVGHCIMLNKVVYKKPSPYTCQLIMSSKSNVHLK